MAGKKTNRKMEIVVILSAVILVLFVVHQMILANFIPDLSTEGFVLVGVDVDLAAQSGNVKLFSECYEMNATVERAQAVSIRNGIEGVVGERPNSHDLARDMLKSLDAKISMVKITELRDGAYISKMIVKSGGKIFSFDSRPSDAIAIAARTDYEVPIYFNETLMKMVGKKTC